MKFLILLIFLVSVCVSQSVEENEYNLLSTAGKITKHVPIIKTIRRVLSSFIQKNGKELTNLTTVSTQKNVKNKEVQIYSFKIMNDTVRTKRNVNFFMDSVKNGMGPVAKQALVLSSVTTAFSAINHFLNEQYNKLFDNRKNVSAPVKILLNRKLVL